MTRLNRFLGTGSSGENVGNNRLKTVFDSESKLKPGIPRGKVSEKKLPARVKSGKTTTRSQLCGARSVLRDKEKTEKMLVTTGSKQTLIRRSKL